MVDFEQKFSLNALIAVQVARANEQLDTVEEWTRINLEVLQGRLEYVRSVSRRFSDAISALDLLREEDEEDDPLVRACRKREDVKELRARIVRIAERLAEAIAERQLKALNDMLNSFPEKTGRIVAVIGGKKIVDASDASEVITKLGGYEEVAALCDISSSAVRQWAMNNLIPPARMQFFRALRPELFGEKK